MKDLLKNIFQKLHEKIEAENLERRLSGALLLPPSKIEVLGQTSLLLQPELTVSSLRWSVKQSKLHRKIFNLYAKQFLQKNFLNF